MENKNRPAFPTGRSIKFDFPDIISIPNHGITKRELFAAMAMQGILANPHQEVVNIKNIARASVEQADDLLRELDKTEAQS